MSEQLLKQILSELKDVKSQLDENTKMTKAIYHRQEETDAKLEALSMDVHKAYGKITSLEDKLTFNSFKNYQNEAEIFKLKREFGTNYGTSEKN